MFKLTFALLLLVSGCRAQCTSHSCKTQIKVIMQRLDELTLENKKQMATIEGQEIVNQKLRTTTGRLETTNAELRTTIEQLRSTNEQLRSTNEQLQTAVNSLQMNISHIQTTSTDLQTTNDQLRETVNSLQRNVTQMQATSPASAVYFSVAANEHESYNNGDAIKFGHTFTNVVPAGTTGGWDAATNMFTCPVTGDYMFVVSLWRADNDDDYYYNDFAAHLIRTSLSGADTDIARLYYYINPPSTSAAECRRSCRMIVPCAAGQKVWVQATCSWCYLWDGNWHLNTFTGFKL